MCDTSAHGQAIVSSFAYLFLRYSADRRLARQSQRPIGHCSTKSTLYGWLRRATNHCFLLGFAFLEVFRREPIARQNPPFMGGCGEQQKASSSFHIKQAFEPCIKYQSVSGVPPRIGGRRGFDNNPSKLTKPFCCYETDSTKGLYQSLDYRPRVQKI